MVLLLGPQNSWNVVITQAGKTIKNTRKNASRFRKNTVITRQFRKNVVYTKRLPTFTSIINNAILRILKKTSLFRVFYHHLTSINEFVYEAVFSRKETLRVPALKNEI